MAKPHSVRKNFERACGTGPIREQPELLFFDLVLHIPASAIEFVVELSRATGEVADNKARIRPLVIILDTGNHTAFTVPGRCTIAKCAQ